jgi:glycolate oxidase iron-sulfur subunit
MRLVDHARAHIEERYRRPAPERFLRWMLASVLSRPALFRWALRVAAIGHPFAPLLPGRLKGMAAMAPRRLPKPCAAERPGVFPAVGARRARVAILAGCAQPVLNPAINEAAVRVLTRLGVEVTVSQGAGCCGALPHHMGKAERAHALAEANIRAWTAETEGQGLDAIIVTASGCGTTVKDYGHMFRDHPELAEPAARISALARDVSEYLAGLGRLPVAGSRGLTVAYHSACSLQHGQKLRDPPKELLKACGYAVVEPAEAHICCGSAGTYNLLQPELAGRLGARKAGHLEATGAQAIASGNIGCMTQIAGATAIPVVHTVELVDWAMGGPVPEPLRGL